MDSSPFNRSARTARTPPPTPGAAYTESPKPPPARREEMEVVTTADIQTWLTTIESCLNDICSTTAEGKLNSEQKLRVSTLCRKVAHGSSQMACLYQSLKSKAILAQTTIKTLEEKVEISQQIKNLEQKIAEVQNPAPSNTFADMVKKGSNNFIRAPANHNAVAIYPVDKQKSSEETKTLVQRLIRPEEMKLHVRGLRKTRNGGVIISTDNKEDVEKLKRSVQLTSSGFTMDEPQKRKPKVVIIGVPSNMQETEVFTCLFNQNLADKLENTDLQNFLSAVKLSHKSGKKDSDTCNFVVEVTGVIRKALISKDRAFINWSSCPVRDFTLVTRCYKCQQYGHAAKSCREAHHTCGHCAEQGHSIQDCPKKEAEPKCATCLHFKKPDNHKTGDKECPAKQQAEKRYINSIDYGGA